MTLTKTAGETRSVSLTRQGNPGGARVLREAAITAGLAGVAGLVALAAVGSTGVLPTLAGMTVVALGVGVIAGSLWAVTNPKVADRRMRVSGRQNGRGARREARTVTLAVGVVTAGAVQTWFTWGRSLAGGDVTPPAGTAWIAHLFAPWAWTGSNLGVPNASETQLPWAVVLEVVHLLGGPAWLAQRLWLTLLFAGAALAALALLRTVGIRPLAAGAGALVYVLNPYVLSTVGFNDVFLAAMVLLAAYPAAVLAAASGRLSKRAAVLVIVAGAPLLGFAYQNPPLSAMIAVVTALSAIVAAWMWGRAAAKTAGAVVVTGGLLLGATSAYWIVPSLLQLSVDATGRLSTVSGWAWTEGRANLANGLWLDTTWAWKFPIYFPFARAYGRFPLDVLKFLLPILAFSAPPLALLAPASPAAGHHQRLGLASAGGALFLVVLGTGTNAPGSVLFDPLYHLPYGWLLQEPGRFLMAAGLGYALLVAITLEAAGSAVAAAVSRRDRPHRPLPRRRHRLCARSGIAHGRRATIVLGAVLLAALVPAYPLALGQVAPSHRRGIYPSERVTFPPFWATMASYLNHQAPDGNLLVLPVDDFYQMPYRWGYYGTDGFITDLLTRHVLDPSAEGYQSLSPELGSAVDAVSASLIDRQWVLAARLLAALGTPQILVRGDVVASWPGRSIVSPRLLASRLRSDPSMRVVHRSGPLTLFEDTAVVPSPLSVTTKVATVNRIAPDLRVLAQLPAGTELVSGPLRAGLPGVIQLPGLADWHLSGGRLVAEATTPPGWHYRLIKMGSSKRGASASKVGRRLKGGGLLPGLVERRLPGRRELAVNVRNNLPDGSFARGPWQRRVGNCDDAGGTNEGAGVSGTVLADAGPAGTPALRLRASVDAACESTPLPWHGGPLILSMSVRNLGGAPPQFCVWETAGRRCAAGSRVFPASSKWNRVQAMVTPSPASGPLELFVYADKVAPGQVTVNEYADVAAYPSPRVGKLAFLARPDHARHTYELRVADSSYSNAWIAPRGRHVVVDGMRNGWLQDAGDVSSRPIRFAPLRWEHYADLVSLTAYLVALALALMAAVRVAGRRPHAGPGRVPPVVATDRP